MFYVNYQAHKLVLFSIKLEAIPQKRIDEDPELASDLNQIFSELEYCADHHKEFN